MLLAPKYRSNTAFKGGGLWNFLTTGLTLILRLSYEKNSLFAQHFFTIVIFDLVVNYIDKTCY